MIIVVEPDYADLYAAELEEMYRLRHRVFNERMKWNVSSHNGMERDQFDELDPTYILAFDKHGIFSGTWRLLPTNGPYMLRDVFSELLEGLPAPNDGKIWESSRFAVECQATGKEGLYTVNAITREMFCGLVEYLLSKDVNELITAYDVRIGRLLKRIGCAPYWQSGLHPIGPTKSIAGRFLINKEVLACIRDSSGITRSVLHVAHEPSELDWLWHRAA